MPALDRITVVTLWLFMSSACAEDLGVDSGEDEQATTSNEDSGLISHEQLGAGVLRSTVDASDEEDWVYLDLDTGSETRVDDPGWDLGFRRFEIIVNGGVSGPAGVEVATLDAVSFNSLAEAPSDAVWTTDETDGDDEDDDPDAVFVDWYAYDFMTHVLTPKDRLYLVRSGEAAVFELQLVDYYSTAGTSGFPTFDWAPLD